MSVFVACGLLVLAGPGLAGCTRSDSAGTKSDPAATAPTEAPVTAATPESTTTLGGDPAKPPPAPASMLAGGLVVTRSGGLAGYQQTLTVAADGSWVFTDKRAGKTEQGRLTSAQLGQIAQLLADPAFAQEAKQPPPAPCNDGVTVTVKAGELSARSDQCGGAAPHPATNKVIAALVDATPL